VRRSALLVIAAATLAMVVPTAPATAMGGTLTGSFLCENTLVTASGTASTAINAAPQDFVTTVDMPDSADAGTGASAQVTIAASSGGTMPLSPPVALPGVAITGLEVRLDVYRSTTNRAIDISPTVDMTAGSAPVSLPTFTQAAGTAWDLPTFQVTAPVTGPSGGRAWVRVKQFSFTWGNAGQGWTGTTTCRLAAAQAFPAGPTTVEQPIFGALTTLSRQYPVAATNVNLSGTELEIRAQLADRVTFTGTSPPPPSSSCTVTDPSGCTTGQQVTATVTAGSLSQQADAAATNPSSTAIVLTKQNAASKYTYAGAPAVTVETASQVMEGALNPVTVTDVRGGTAGWSLTASLSDPFTEVGGGQMAKAAAKLVQVGCAPVAGSATRTPGTGGTLSSAVTLCGVDPGVDDSDGQSGGGQYTISGAVELTVPAFQKAGEYTSTLVITLT
jgi:hypothetical protein